MKIYNLALKQAMKLQEGVFLPIFINYFFIQKIS